MFSKIVFSFVTLISMTTSQTCQTTCPDGWTGDGITCTAPGSYTGPCSTTSVFTGYLDWQRVDWAQGCDTLWESCGVTDTCLLCDGQAPCLDLIQDQFWHLVMALDSDGLSHITRSSDNFIWNCDCSNCNGLVGTWNCPGFYDDVITIDSDTADSLNRFTAHSACDADCQSKLCLAAPTASPTLNPTANPTASPTASPTLPPTTEYSDGYNTGKSDEKSNACAALGCCEETRRRLVDLEEIHTEYLNVKDDLQNDYFNYVLGYGIVMTLITLVLSLCLCYKKPTIIVQEHNFSV